MKPKALLIAGLGLLGAVLGARAVVHQVSRFDAPAVDAPAFTVEKRGSLRVAGRSSVHAVGRILEVHLSGTPEQIGAAHATLLHDEMRETEGVVWKLLEQKVPSALARALLLDLGQLTYRNVVSGMSAERTHELSASAARFTPDPFAGHFPTFQRFVYLSALYDISLGYEHSPLLGCTTFTFSGAHAEGSPILARAFDFDVDDVFDERKAVYLVREDGKIPFASVAWPGFVGVVSGLNREGLGAVVHGARAGPTRTAGEPVAHELRRLLSEARTTEEAVKLLPRTEPLVSHIVVLSDAAGRAVRVERVPGAAPFVLPLAERDAVTNHLAGPHASDPKNVRVRSTTSTLARKERADELVSTVDRASTREAIALLRDRKGARGEPLALGDRSAIDALIATHAVVMETKNHRLWVSEAPHMLGRFVAFDLDAAFAEGAADEDRPHAELPPDDLLTSGDYARIVVQKSPSRQ